MPATRRLAADLDVSRGVVIEAYQQLVAEGYLTSRAGSYTRVAIDPPPLHPPTGVVPGPDPAAGIDFSPCRADGSRFARTQWLRSMRRVVVGADLGYVSPRGAPPLRDALAAYLNRVRGTSATPGDIVVCSGYAQGSRSSWRCSRSSAPRASRWRIRVRTTTQSRPPAPPAWT